MAELPAGTRPGRVRLQVADLDRSLDWYQRVLGFQVTAREDDAARLAPCDDAADPPADAGNWLVELRERENARPAPPGGRPGLYHYAILLPDRPALGRFVRHLSAAGIRAGASDHRVSEALYLQDPDGLGIEVYADRPRSTWAIRDGQIVMSTDPLDVNDLARSAGEAAWDGMPAGTTIGHVHLHVGDLGRAEAFYRNGLGLERTVWSYPGALFLAAGGYHHHLGLNTWARSTSPPGRDDARLLEWELVLPSGGDVDAAVGRLEAAGEAVMERGPGTGVARDPWGTTLRLRAR
ncbi:MAG TPA: VOC family protein [Longimicrobiales bacterium]|nr:VOC family protein [Longimicrobiales bacterium]